MSKHLLFSQNLDQPVQWFDKFDKEAIKDGIVKHLTTNPTDCIEHCKEPLKNDLNRFYGYILINFYGVNPNNHKISRIVRKGNRTYYKQLN